MTVNLSTQKFLYFINSKILTNIFDKISVFIKLKGGNNENYRCKDGEIFY